MIALLTVVSWFLMNFFLYLNIVLMCVDTLYIMFMITLSGLGTVKKFQDKKS